jgi:putative hydrolase of the HAD superfamily
MEWGKISLLDENKSLSEEAMFDLIAFDADDTLWENNLLYIQAQDRFKEILSHYAVSDSIDNLLEKIETQNLKYYGYGVTSFVFSLLETAIEITGERISAADIRVILGIAKEMISTQVRLYDDVDLTLRTLAERYRMVLITKGDLLHQQSKVSNSGLRVFFHEVNVVVDKTPQIYAELLKRYGVSPSRFLMIGDSMRSDILPVLELGGWGVYVPNNFTWSHEKREPPTGFDGRYFEVERLGLLPALLEKLDRT